MFESLVTPNSNERRLDPRILPVTVAVHAGTLLVMMVASVWKVEDLPVPMAAFEQPFIEVTLPPPPPAAPPRGVERQQVTAPEKPAVPEVVQPEIVPPAPPEEPQTTGTSVPLDDLAATSGDQGIGSADGVDGSIGQADGHGKGDCTVDCDDGSTADAETPTIIVPGILKPQVLQRVNPLYPEPARRIGKQGNVIVEAVIDTSGNVRDVKVLSRPLGLGLEESAIAAVKQWRFSPATRHGKPVSVYFQLTVTFSLYR